MSRHSFGSQVACHLQSMDDYAFSEDARDATRYVQRIAVLRQACYHGMKTGSEDTPCGDIFPSSVGERF